MLILVAPLVFRSDSHSHPTCARETFFHSIPTLTFADTGRQISYRQACRTGICYRQACRIQEQDQDGMIKGLALCAQLAYVQMVKTLKGHMISRLQKPAL